MRRASLIACACLCLAAPGVAQNAALVVGAGNFFSPIVANLERAVAFYRDGLGLQVTGTPSDATDNAPLRNMFGLPGAQLRWTVARPANARQGVEIVEISQASGRALTRRIADPGAMTLMLSTPEPLADVVTRVTQHGGTAISAGGRGKDASAQFAVLRDPDDHFVQLTAAGAGASPLPPRIRLTVHDLQRTLALYRDALGLDATATPATSAEVTTTALGLSRGTVVQTRALGVPGSTLTIEFIQVGTPAAPAPARIQDPGSTRLQLQVRDLDAAITAVVAAGGQVVSTGGVPVEMPAGRGAPLRAAIVRDPDNLFVVAIQAR